MAREGRRSSGGVKKGCKRGLGKRGKGGKECELKQDLSKKENSSTLPILTERLKCGTA